MSNLTITVEAPELTAAILRLADAMKGNTVPAAAPASVPSVPMPAVREPIQQPAPVAPVQQAPAVPVTVPPTMQPAAPAYPAPAPAAPIAAAPAYTLDQLQVAIGPLMDAGKGPQLQGLLAKYGVQRMPDLRPDQLPAFAADLRGLGARI